MMTQFTAFSFDAVLAGSDVGSELVELPSAKVLVVKRISDCCEATCEE